MSDTKTIEASVLHDRVLLLVECSDYALEIELEPEAATALALALSTLAHEAASNAGASDGQPEGVI